LGIELQVNPALVHGLSQLGFTILLGTGEQRNAGGEQNSYSKRYG
jgi:hypothetical protein